MSEKRDLAAELRKLVDRLKTAEVTADDTNTPLGDVEASAFEGLYMTLEELMSEGDWEGVFDHYFEHHAPDTEPFPDLN